MKEHLFTLILSRDPSEDESDKLYGTFNDGTIATIAGLPQISFHRLSGIARDCDSFGPRCSGDGFTVMRVGDRTGVGIAGILSIFRDGTVGLTRFARWIV